ncbi:MAG: glycosyltransferase [Deltaproteobacteria bacterium]|nr:MAG: glycosyltransferase [Deltaproteobacteria bacterium]
MKILMLNALTEQSGSGVRFWSIAKELARQGHSLFFLERSITKNGRLSNAGIRYRSSPDTGIQWLDILRATWLNLCQGLRLRPQWVFVLKPMPNTCLPALLSKWIFKHKIVLDIDDLDFDYYLDGPRRQLVLFFFRFFPSHFDLITTHNRYLQNFIIDELGISPEKIYFLPQGVETEKFLQAHSDQRYQEKWGIKPDDEVIVYSASLGITSDFQHVLPMLKDFVGKRENVKVLVIGDGSRKPYFVNRVEAYGLQERIIFTGYLDHAHMPMVLKLAKVGINYMAPTRANKSRASIKVREYLAAGLNVVCNPVGDAETFKDYVTLCTGIEEFPTAIEKALGEKNPENAREAQKFVERNFSWPHLVEDFLSQLEHF